MNRAILITSAIATIMTSSANADEYSHHFYRRNTLGGYPTLFGNNTTFYAKSAGDFGVAGWCSGTSSVVSVYVLEDISLDKIGNDYSIRRTNGTRSQITAKICDGEIRQFPPNYSASDIEGAIKTNIAALVSTIDALNKKSVNAIAVTVDGLKTEIKNQATSEIIGAEVAKQLQDRLQAIESRLQALEAK